jgi:hypothetical protein
MLSLRILGIYKTENCRQHDIWGTSKFFAFVLCPLVLLSEFIFYVLHTQDGKLFYLNSEFYFNNDKMNVLTSME